MEPLTLTREQLATRRAQAAALFEEDLSNAEIGRRIGISRPTVSKWRQAWNAQGEAGLQLHPPGSPARLTPEQVQQVTAALLEGAQAHGFPTPLWTLERISHLIADLTGVTYHPGYVWYLLKEWNWSCQKPEAVAKERDEPEIKRWQSEEFPRIKKGAKRRAAKLVFLDESGFSLKSSLRRTWAPRGQTPIVHSHFNWDRLNVLGGLICQPDGSEADLLLAMQEKTVKEEAVIAFLKALHHDVPGRIVLLLDHLPAHRSEKVAAYMAENTSWLTVEWLPSYASDLNPMEYFWSAAKGEPTANSGPDTLSEIGQSVNAFRDEVASDQDRLYGFLAASGLFPSKDDCSLT